MSVTVLTSPVYVARLPWFLPMRPCRSCRAMVLRVRHRGGVDVADVRHELKCPELGSAERAAASTVQTVNGHKPRRNARPSPEAR